ncbi:hypothetical protein CLV46_0741 [Diaminobutyricimonas aerilata]|uniref:Signal transduction histidine kinase n=1 Tax=Diaminobutyricimonas aerilata TaxID=1162967 RepID=A0A2M9CH41_9MICO|nr:hypothetical protein [Diaminobutyricimonas aerilata]PJJ71199.1 hypothetical protein CLV46_0741 [Diaminobutyricimonas aerilata]
MNIGVPRSLIVGMGALFSAYHVVLALYSIDIPRDPGPVLLAIAIYVVATTVSLLPWGPVRMPIWLAAFNVAVCVAMAVLVTHELDPLREGGNGYATWYVAAIGTLMTITSTRRRHAFAWIGVSFLAVQTIVWAGFGALGGIGVIGSISWVAVSHILSSGMAKASRDAQRFAVAEREATEWQAAQEAHLYERRFRLGQTSTMALPMLRTIQASGGALTEEQRRECLNLEGAIRDEIRGRRLLNDAVRDQVMAARRRGATVTLLDEGGIDDLGDDELDRVLNRLATAIESTSADRVIARTVPEGSDVAVTVVGLRSVGDDSASALGPGSEDDEVDLWLEIKRTPD